MDTTLAPNSSDEIQSSWENAGYESDDIFLNATNIVETFESPLLRISTIQRNRDN